MSEALWRASSAPPRLESGAVDVWRADLDDRAWEGSVDLSNAERERAAGLRGEANRRRWVASRSALRAVLALYLGGEARLPEEFMLGPHGKPTLGHSSPIRFNLSHSGGLALIAVGGDLEVGIDLELVDPRREVDSLIPLALDREAAARVLGTIPAERPLAFHEAWVRREATVKCGGEGLVGEPAGGAVALTPIDPGPGYMAALAVAAVRQARPRLFLAGPSVAIGALGSRGN